MFFPWGAIMPFITLQHTVSPDTEQSCSLADALTRLTARILRKDPRRTSVLLRPTPPEQWFIDGVSLAALGRHAFRLEVTVTDETCTRDEKIRFQREAFDLLSAMIGDLHPHSNVHVIDCRAAAYGYGGVTQERHMLRREGQSAATASPDSI